MPKTCVSGMFGEVSPGHRGSPEQRTADGSLPSAGQLHSCPAAQPQPQNEPGGMFDTQSIMSIITELSCYRVCDIY